MGRGLDILLSFQHAQGTSCCVQAEAAAFSGRRRSITWRDRSGLATLPRSDEDASDLVSRERSYPGGLPDVHEEVNPQPVYDTSSVAYRPARGARGGAAAAGQIICEEEIHSSEPGICMRFSIVCD